MIHRNPKAKLNELKVIIQLCKQWSCQFELYDDEMSKSDAKLIKDGNLVLHVEVKCRDNSLYQYPYYLIDVAKIRHGLSLSARDKVPFTLAVKFTEGIYWMNPTAATADDSNCEWLIRTDRNDPNDKDWACRIWPKEFKKLWSINGTQTR